MIKGEKAKSGKYREFVEAIKKAEYEAEVRLVAQRYECLWWPYKTHKRKNAIYGFFRLGLPYSFFRVALMGFLGLPYGKVRIYIEYLFRIKLGFIRIT